MILVLLKPSFLRESFKMEPIYFILTVEFVEFFFYIKSLSHSFTKYERNDHPSFIFLSLFGISITHFFPYLCSTIIES